tara:strand:- start:109 stop:432 length:324 start_codon:yes stop_codon:yes gene_type:complete
MKIQIKNSQAKNKRFVAVFTDDKGKSLAIRPQGKKVNFGLKNPKIGTYIDTGDKELRKNYIARHEVREKKFYNDPMKPATLSRFILWGDSSSLKQNIENYKRKFNLS